MKIALVVRAGLLAVALSCAADTIQNIAGNGTAGFKGDGGLALEATLDNPFGVVRGPDGALWFADYAAHVVRRIDANGTISTVVGNGVPGPAGQGGPATESSLFHPHEIRFERSGSLLIADTDHQMIRRYDPATKRLSNFAGTGEPGYSGDGGDALGARFNLPISLQIAPSGDLFVADIGNHVVRRVDAKTHVVTTFAGTGKAGTTPDGSPIDGTPLNGPRSLDFDAGGNLLLVTREGNQLLRFDLALRSIHVVAGTGKKGMTGDGGSAREATLNGPKGLSVAPNGDVYLADTENHAIRKIDVRRGTIERVAGTGEKGDGPVGDARSARLSRPHGVFVDTDGSVLVGDSENHRIRRIASGQAATLDAHRFLDLADQTSRQVVVDREPGQYLGHPTTLLLEDGHTILVVYPKGHGRGAIQFKRSTDGGLTWSARLPVPENWATSRETPTIHRVVDAAGKRRIVLFSGLHPVRTALSEDDGGHWTELAPAGEWGGIVAMASVVPTAAPGSYLALFHDDGRYFQPHPMATKPPTFTLYSTRSSDGGVTWSFPETILARSDVHLCEPGAVRSPDGREIAVLLRENSRTRNSFLITSRDDGKTWTTPRELPAALTGDRHTAKYARDGRLFVSFRDMAAGSATRGDWVAWVGRYDDIVRGRPGQYRVRLMDNTKDYDCAYPGVEVLPDDTIVTTTYGHWAKGEMPYIVSVRLKLAELDSMARRR